jgi:hypothetical protein
MFNTASDKHLDKDGVFQDSILPLQHLFKPQPVSDKVQLCSDKNVNPQIVSAKFSCTLIKCLVTDGMRQRFLEVS